MERPSTRIDRKAPANTSFAQLPPSVTFQRTTEELNLSDEQARTLHRHHRVPQRLSNDLRAATLCNNLPVVALRSPRFVSQLKVTQTIANEEVE